MKQVYEQMMEQVAKDPEKNILIRISLIPSYIEGMITLVIIGFLVNKLVKDYYNKILGVVS